MVDQQMSFDVAGIPCPHDETKTVCVHCGDIRLAGRGPLAHPLSDSELEDTLDKLARMYALDRLNWLREHFLIYRKGA